MKTKSILLSACMMAALSSNAQVTIDIDGGNRGKVISPMLYGIFFEDINHAADGGLYAELISNRSFEDNAKGPANWMFKSETGSSINGQLQKTDLLNDVQHQALMLDVKASKEHTARLQNEGFWGINAVQGRNYKLSFWAKGKYNGSIRARLVSADGKTVYAETPVEAKISNKWTKFTAEMKSNGNDEKAVFEFVFDGKGGISLDVVSLFPPTFMNRENGCRPDLAQMLYNLRPKFMRFPGGCFVEGQESPENAFHWEKTIGPIEEREGHRNVNWGYRTTDGLGFHEYLQLSEDLGAKPLYVVNVGLWHGGLTPVDSLQPWIDECMNALEYANGDVTTKYGAMRAKNGHPAPFNIEYLEIGNENNQPDAAAQSDHYYDRYRLFKEAVLKKYPKMHLIGNVVAWGDDNPKWESSETVELLDEHYYRNPAWFADNFHKYDTYERGKAKIYCGEYAVTQGFGKVGSLNAALGEAVFMMGMENNGDVVEMASYAPIFVNENNVAWQPDMIRFNSARAMGTPSYYVQKLMAENVGTRVLAVNQQNPYEMKGEAEQKPEAVSVGFGTWATQASFDDIKITVDGKVISDNCSAMSTFKAVRGTWNSDGGMLNQTADGESCIAVNNTKFSPKKYTMTCRARKNSGNEGFLIVYNYVSPDNYSWFNLGGWNNTQHGLEQISDGGKAQMGTKAGAVETGRWYDIRIDVDGDSVACYLDGKLMFESKARKNVTPGLFTSAAIDEATGEMIVKVANTSATSTTADLRLKNFAPRSARAIRLKSANGKDENTLDQPTAVYPVEETLTVGKNGLLLDVPAYSLSIVRIKR